MIVATAGHVDHGKTSLVRNLTGVETDRLEEERRRGLSIELGYAYWRPDDDTVIGFIDVPGHRRFINNMIAGISGIDLGMLVVAADDGVMPQTLEHVQVMTLLGVENYLLVVSKCDSVEPDRVDEVSRQAAKLLPPSTPVHTVSNSTGDGIDTLGDELRRLAGIVAARQAGGHFRMSIDRAFNLPGRGLIVTGTVASGAVAVGGSLVLQPQGQVVRVRGIHTQDQAAETATAGERCALNIAGDVHKDDIERGDWVAAEGCIAPTRRFDARVRMLGDAPFPLKHLAEVKLHIGAKHVTAKMMLLRPGSNGTSRMQPGDDGFVQFVTGRPVLCCHGDRFLLRDFGETATVGGGVVIDPDAPARRKASGARLAMLDALQQPDIEAAIERALADESRVIDYGALLLARNVAGADRPGDSLPHVARVRTPDAELWLARPHWDRIKQVLAANVAEFHESQPDEPGIRAAALVQNALFGDERRLSQPAIVELVKSGELAFRDGVLSVPGFEPELSGKDDRDWRAVAVALRRFGMQVPNRAQLADAAGLSAERLDFCLERGVRDRRLVRINAERHAEPSLLGEFAAAVLETTRDKPAASVVELRDRLGCGRNVLIEILEYFDSIGFTRRTGNERIVLDRKLPAEQFATKK